MKKQAQTVSTSKKRRKRGQLRLEVTAYRDYQGWNEMTYISDLYGARLTLRGAHV